MEAPKCRTCGERHWERICPKNKAAKKTAEKPGHRARKVVVEKTAKSDAPTESPVTRDGSHKSKKDRNEYHKNYMREYMRKQRAKTKREK